MPSDFSSSNGIGAPEDMVEGRTLVGSDPFHEDLDRGNLCFGGYPFSFRAACQRAGSPKRVVHRVGNYAAHGPVRRSVRDHGLHVLQQYQRAGYGEVLRLDEQHDELRSVGVHRVLDGFDQLVQRVHECDRHYRDALLFGR